MDIESIANKFYYSDGDSSLILDIFNSHDEHPDSEIALVAYEHFLNPVLPAQDLDIPLNKVTFAYSWLTNSNVFQNLITSDFYPYAMMIGYSKKLIEDLVNDPEYFTRLINNLPLSPKRLEIHTTNASCNLLCEMCLWRAGQDELEYTAEEMETGVLSVEQWKQVLKEAHSLGTEIAIFSGGGEPQLREESSDIIKFSRELGQKIMIYTNGTLLTSLADKQSPLYEEFMQSDWLRVSLHAATNETYSRLVGLPQNQNNLIKVTEGIERILEDREKLGSNVKIGMNIVIQVSNYQEIEKYVDMAHKLGVDFVNIRVDCVNVTRDLLDNEKTILYDQLRTVRANYINKKYSMFIDFADVLIAPMNGWKDFILSATPQCRVHQYRAAINPFGRVAVCDLMAEPHYSCSDFTLGFLSEKSYAEIMEENAAKKFPGDRCNVCMPGQISINSVYHKIISDAKFGIQPEQQLYKLSL